jgi:hypothetical protein
MQLVHCGQNITKISTAKVTPNFSQNTGNIRQTKQAKLFLTPEVNLFGSFYFKVLFTHE